MAGDDADHPGGPFGVGKDQDGESSKEWIVLDLLLGGAQDLAGEQLAAGVESLQVNGQDAGAAWVGGGEQLDGGVGVIQAAQGVETRAEEEADVLFAQPGRVQFGQFVDGFQAGALGAAQGSQAALEQIAGVAGLKGHIGDDAQGDQVE